MAGPVEGAAVSFREFGCTVIRQRIGRMMGYVRAVRRGNDADAIHDMRVASRRLRAALSIFAEAFDDPAYPRLQKEVRKVTSVLSHARDLDVMIGGLQKSSAALPAIQRTLLVELLRGWSAERREVQGQVVKTLDELTAFDPAAVFEQIVAATGGEVPSCGAQSDEP